MGETDQNGFCNRKDCYVCESLHKGCINYAYSHEICLAHYNEFFVAQYNREISKFKRDNNRNPTKDERDAILKKLNETLEPYAKKLGV